MTRRHLLGLFVLAALVRIAYVLLADPVVRPISDGRNYHLLANNLAAGRGYIAPFDWALLGEARPTAEFMPLHPGVLALASLAGVDTVLGHQLWLSVVGSVTPVLTALLAWRITDDRAIALGAGAVACVHPILLGSDGALMPETLFTALATAAVLALLRDGRGWTLAAGALTGLAVLTRGDGLLLLPLVIVPVLALRHARLEALGRVALATVAVVAVLSPWLVRNAVRFDGQLVLSNNVGSLLNGANCPPVYRGPDIGSWSFFCAERVETVRQDEVESSARMRRAGIDYATDNLDRLPVVAAARVGRAWGLVDPAGQARAESREGRVAGVQLAGVVADWFLLPAFAAGVVLLRRQGRTVSPLVGMLVLVVVLCAAAYGNSRFREVAVPAVIVGAVAGSTLTLRGRTSLTERG